MGSGWTLIGSVLETSNNVGIAVLGPAAIRDSIFSPILAIGPQQNNSVVLANNGSPGNLSIAAPNVKAVGNPIRILDLEVNGPGTLGPVLTLTNTGGGSASAAALDFNTFAPSAAGAYNPSARIEAEDDGNFANDIIFLTNKPGAANNGLVEGMRIASTGNVGIGVPLPTSRLHVAGDVAVTGDVLLTGADCAEHFDAAGDVSPEPGTVVVIDEGGALRESREAYDKKVAGVVSGAGDYRHGLVLDKRPSDEGRVPVALVGKVYCKVDAQYSPIEVGDLLTTSPTPGYAMKAAEPQKAFGSIIGKALKSLATGSELIPILVALQ